MIGVDIRPNPYWDAKGNLHDGISFIETSFHWLAYRIPENSIDMAYSHLGIRQAAI